MKADLTRRTHRAEKHYARVIHQQGRVPLDADLNEQFEIEEHLAATEAIDVIGRAGAPKGDSFKVAASPDKKDLLVLPGTFYVDGLLCESETHGDPASLVAATKNVLQLGALTLGVRALAPAEWLQVSSATTSKLYRVRAIAKASRRITLGAADDLVADFGGAALTIRRVSSYIVQPDSIRPEGTSWPAPANPDSLTEAELPSIDATKITAGTYLVYLDVWRRHLTALEDPSIREVALGGPDTTTRAKTVWQIELRRIGAAGAMADCGALPSPQLRGALSARANLPAIASNPCELAPGSKYRRLENQLYRVEIHDPGTIAGGTSSGSTVSFKFSRDNGSIVVRWLSSGTNEIGVDSIGRDAMLGFASGNWIELCDDDRELAGKPGTLAQIDSVVGTTIKLKPIPAPTGSTNLADFRGHPRVRRWDHVAGPSLEVKRDAAVNAGWLALEDGVECRFDDGDYATGDYWTIPARTITTDVEWPFDLDGKPIARPPEGVEHHLASLAVVEWTGTEWKDRTDGECRVQFPPLTHICADDVCLHGDPCDLGATTVQQAIEQLCAQNDLPWHNQHLHGFGVVCGLQVNCLPIDSTEDNPREKVIVRSGYAIDPYGMDLRVDVDQVVPVVDMIEQSGIAERDAAGNLPDLSVSMWIDRSDSAGAFKIKDANDLEIALRLHVEKYVPQKWKWQDLLEGTILKDFYHHCIQNVIEFLKAQVTPQPDEANDLVGPTWKRLITLLNLAAQYINPKTGAFVYLSGEMDDAAEGPNHEDKILRDFCNGLRALLQSETFCGMFDDVTFPDYDVYKTGFTATTVPHPSTIFGRSNPDFAITSMASSGCHDRIRIHPAGKWGVTVGSNNVHINVFDLPAGKMVARNDFPDSGAWVQDVAFEPGTDNIYAVGWIGTAKTDSMVVAGRIGSDGTITWSQNQVTCAKKFVTLASGAVPRGKLFAAARGGGIFRFDMATLVTNPPQVGGDGLDRATGHMVLVPRVRPGAVNDAYIVAGFHATDANPVSYNQIVKLSIGSDGNDSATAVTWTIPSTQISAALGSDGVAGIWEQGNDGATRSEIHVVVDGSSGQNKSLLVLDGDAPAGTASIQHQASLEENTTNRLAYNAQTKQLFITYEGPSYGRQYSTHAADPTLQSDKHPLQIGPISVAAGPDGTRWYVLNYVSNTITVIPAQVPNLHPYETTIDRAKLAAYRAAVIQAFLKLIGRFLQYLKDCFCGLLLVDCPDPTGKKVYLADISIRDGLVYQICNFSRRKYVHTFPTVEYWLSVVPIIPLIKKAVEQFCCSILPGWFDKLEAPSQQGNDKVSASMFRTSGEWVRAADLSTMFRQQRAQIMVTGALERMLAGETLSKSPPGTPASDTRSLDKLELMGRSAEAAAASAEAKGVQVDRVVVADSAFTAGTIATAFTAPSRVHPGETIDLVTDKTGRVIGFKKKTGTATRPVDEVPRTRGTEATVELVGAGRAGEPQIARLTEEVTSLRAAHASHARTIEDLRAEIASLRGMIRPH